MLNFRRQNVIDKKSQSDKVINKKLKSDKIGKITSVTISWFLAVIFLAIIGFIVFSSIEGFKAYGWSIFGSLDFNLASQQGSVWYPLAITLLVTIGAIIIASPIGIKTATFIHFRLNKKYQKRARIVISTLSGIPSVIFGIFAYNSLWFVTKIFGATTPYTILNAMIMLAFMILPTIISLTINSYQGISNNLITGPTALGLTKTAAIYKVYRKEATSGIIVAIIIATGRAIGETMALSMILSADNYNALGDSNIFLSAFKPLAVIISSYMFSETSSPALRGILYVFAIILLIIILIINALVMFVTSKRNVYKNTRWTRFERKIGEVFLYFPNLFSMAFERIMYKNSKNFDYQNESSVNFYISDRIVNHKLINLYSFKKLALEWISITISFSFLIWIIGDILIKGGNVIFVNAGGFSTIFQYTRDTTGLAIINTIIIIIVSLLVALPIAFFVALYLNEFSKDGKSKKAILFFNDSLSSAPSIIYGMFGLAFFIELLGLTSSGTMGRSLLAGALTIALVIIPTLVRTFEQALKKVPMNLRHNAYSLGCGKMETIWKIVIPFAYTSISSSIILAIGRIMAETAPLFLTAGLSSISTIGLLNPGQTLTTRIYAQIFSNNLSGANDISYECAFVAFIIILAIIYIGYGIIPIYKDWKQVLIYKIKEHKSLGSSFDKIPLDIYYKQIINKTLYLTYEQADNLKLNRFINIAIKYNKKILRIKYIDNLKMEQLVERKLYEK